MGRINGFSSLVLCDVREALKVHIALGQECIFLEDLPRKCQCDRRRAKILQGREQQAAFCGLRQLHQMSPGVWLESKLHCCCKKALPMGKSQLFCLDAEVSKAVRNHPCAAGHSSNISLGQDLHLLLFSLTVSPAL